jgi:hypothetical protein
VIFFPFAKTIIENDYFVTNLIRDNAEKIPQPRHTCLCLHNFREKGDTVGESAMPPIETSV